MNETSRADHRLAEIRRLKRLDQDELARRAGTSRGQIANLEAGRRGMTLDWLRRLARALDCDVTDLLLPEDRPRMPSEEEAAVLAQLRRHHGIDSRLLLEGVTAVLEATASLRSDGGGPALAGSRGTARAMAQTWASLSGSQREQALRMIQSAQALAGDDRQHAREHAAA